MKNFLIHGLIGLAAFVWLVGLVIACRTDTGTLIVLLAGVYLAVRFSPALVQGRVRDEIRRAYPNEWFRRYLMMFAYTLLAFPGLMSLCGKWRMDSVAGYAYNGYAPIASANENWGLALMVALFLPAMMLAVASQTNTHPLNTANED